MMNEDNKMTAESILTNEQVVALQHIPKEFRRVCRYAIKTTVLDLRRIAIKFDDVKNYIFPLLKISPTIIKLSLYGMNLKQDGASMAHFLRDVRCVLIALDLSHTIMINEDIAFITGALTDPNCNLKELNLTHTVWSNENLRFFGETLKHPNCKLAKLDFTSTQLKDKRINPIADALKHNNCKLTYLNLTKCQVSEQGVGIIIEALKVNRSITTILGVNITLKMAIRLQCNTVKYKELEEQEIINGLQCVEEMNSSGITRNIIFQYLNLRGDPPVINSTRAQPHCDDECSLKTGISRTSMCR